MTAESITGAPVDAGPAHFTRESLARYWGVTERHVDALVSTGKLRAVKIGRATRFTLADVRAFEERHARVVDAEGDEKGAPETPTLRAKVIAATRKPRPVAPAPSKPFSQRVEELRARLTPKRSTKGATR